MRVNHRQAMLLAVGLVASTALPAAAGGDGGSGGATEPAYAAALRPRLRRLAAELLVPGGVVLVRSPWLGDWTLPFGTRTLGGGAPVQAGDHFRIGSNTKTWTGTVILQLVQEGRLRLDAPIGEFWPEVPNGGAISIAQLLAMRSGLSNYTESPELNRILDEAPAHVFAPQDLLAIAFARPPLFPPGAAFSYSNTNTVLLGLLIEQLTGNPVEREVQARLFAPLGLRDTLLPARTSSALPAPFARGYMYGTNLETIASEVLPEAQQAAARAGTLQPRDATDGNPSWAWTAGSGISTAGDLARVVAALAGGAYLTPELQRQRLESIQPRDPSDLSGPGYGLALARFGPMYGHTGELPGYNSFAGHDPVAGTTIVTWTNLNAAPDGRAPATELARLIVGELYASPPTVPSPEPGVGG
jgi:D-alanyl-D-alanine carboxypeptidase